MFQGTDVVFTLVLLTFSVRCRSEAFPEKEVSTDKEEDDDSEWGEQIGQ